MCSMCVYLSVSQSGLGLCRRGPAGEQQPGKTSGLHQARSGTEAGSRLPDGGEVSTQ